MRRFAGKWFEVSIVQTKYIPFFIYSVCIFYPVSYSYGRVWMNSGGDLNKTKKILTDGKTKSSWKEYLYIYIFLLSWKWVKGRLTKVAHATQVGECSTLAAYSEKGLFHTLQKCVKADQYNGKESFNNVRLCVLICFCSRLLGFFLAFSVFIFVLTHKDKGSDLGDGPQLYKLAEVYCAIFLFPVL